MRYEIGKPINVVKLNQPMPALVVTEQVYEGVTIYSLAKDTDIPVQTYPTYRCFFLLGGKLEVYHRDKLSILASADLDTGNGIVVPLEAAVGSTVLADSVAVEVILGKKLETDCVVPMQPFKVRDMVCYQPGTAFTKKIFASGFAVFDVSALDMNTELKDQHAIGELILTCLEGEGIVSYRDTEQVIHTGENFRIVRGDNYTLKTNGTQCKVSQLSRVE